ncbi:MAG: hypothetical protein IJ480_07355 [Clostridia bacterium]|nr:hypothetical protein [Clostridia bacterium]
MRQHRNRSGNDSRRQRDGNRSRGDGSGIGIHTGEILILRTRNFDLGLIFDFGGIFSALNACTDSGTIASTLASKEAGAETALAEFVEKVSESLN